MNPETYLRPGEFADSHSPSVQQFAKAAAGEVEEPRHRAIALYYAVRDGWYYDPYRIDLRPAAMRASMLLRRKRGYCVEKANLLVAAARALSIPARHGFAIVRNHIGTDRLVEALKTDLLVFHGYCELYLERRWVKATPAFNKELCDHLGVEALNFDGREDSIFQQFTTEGGQFMEYVHDYGVFEDVPRDLFINELRRHYPHIFDALPHDGNGVITFHRGQA